MDSIKYVFVISNKFGYFYANPDFCHVYSLKELCVC